MDPLQVMIIAGYDLLEQHYRYKQIVVVKKLGVLGYELSPPSFSLAVRGKSIGSDILVTASGGIRELVAKELGHHWKDNSFIDTRGADWQAEIVQIEQPDGPPRFNFIFHEQGRLSIQQKVDFFATATCSVIELGLTLNTFSNYFFSRNEYEFKIPISRLLERGVDFHCYLLDPDCNEARLYFEDRSREIPEEKNGTEKIKSSIERLQKICRFFQGENFPGQFKVLTYRHIPTQYMLLVDPESQHAKTMISHYIYGVSRANCPVLEVHKKQNRDLYRRYWNAARVFVQDAKPLDWQ